MTGAIMQDARKHLFNPDRGAQDVRSCQAAVQRYGGWWGPWVDV